MRYLGTSPPAGPGSTRRISAIGLGTWQFGSREWGYGVAYSEREAARIVRREHDVAAADLVLKDDEVTALGEAAAAFRPEVGVRAAAWLVRARLHA
ncbi:MAG TPA: hypothetical protein VI248_10830 [Kineosporiaceae bacterium]